MTTNTELRDEPMLSEMLSRIVAKLRDMGINDDVALLHLSGDWCVAASNPTGVVMMSGGTARYFSAWHKTAEQACRELMGQGWFTE